MSVLQGLRSWWQVRTGEIVTPFDSDSCAFVTSLVVHVLLLLALGLAPIAAERPSSVVVISAPPIDELEEELTVAQEFAISDQVLPEVGANSEAGAEMALAAAEVLSDVSDVPHPLDLAVVPVGEVLVNNEIQIATGMRLDSIPVRGNAGQGTTGALGAIDRITKDILLSLEQRRTLVVWFFDQSGSLNRQRQQIYDRFDRIYQELGVIEAAGNPAFKKYSDKPLLTSIVAFGQSVDFMTEKPTDDLAEIKSAVAAIKQDDSGLERVFSAVHTAAEQYRKFRQESPARNILFVVFSDEVGDDPQGLDKTVNLCRRLEIPVYVVGVPAPFGKRQTLVKWVDPDPKYDQTPQWAEVNQGPESLLPEVVSLPFIGGNDPGPLDSGFGPYALTRLCFETGGVYFTVHPNRNVHRRVGRGEIDEYTAHLTYFFDSTVMRKYRPDYVAYEEYMRRLSRNRHRGALVKAADLSQVGQLEAPTMRFVRSDEAAFTNALTEAQKAAAILEPRLNALYETLKLGEADRDDEIEPRWQAGYDLAMGRALAAKVRAEGYNAMLAAAKRGLKFSNDKNNTWILESADEFTTGSQLAKAAQLAKQYLERVQQDHAGTPWSMMAELELKTPLGWRWKEEFTNLAPRVAANAGGGNNAAPANPRPNVIAKPPPKRSPPKL